jgi:membrane-associated phospholipid phosphatase
VLDVVRSGLTRELLPRERRRAAALTAAGLVIATVALGLVYAGQHRPGAFDRWADGLITGHPGVTSWTQWIIGIGTPEAALPICLIVVAWCALTRRYRAVALVVVAVPLASALTDKVLKPLFGRTNLGALTYPSGHTTGACVMAAVAILVLAGPSRPPLPALARRLLCAAAVLLVPVVAVGLVYVHFHYLTDTFGGVGVAVSVALLTALAVDVAADRVAARSASRAAPGGISETVRELPRA